MLAIVRYCVIFTAPKQRTKERLTTVIYQYIWLAIIWGIGIFLYKVNVNKVPTTIKKHVYLLQVVILLIVISFIGLPVKFKSTSFTGKHSFQSDHVIVDKVEADPKPATTDLEKQLKLLKQTTKEIQNEID